MAADEKSAVPAAAPDNQIDETLKFSPEEEAVGPPFLFSLLPQAPPSIPFFTRAGTPVTGESCLLTPASRAVQDLVADSNLHKTDANALFTSGQYDAAINKYDEAVAVLPAYLDYELAVLKSNISACYLKLEEWKEAVSSATAALEGLDRLDGRAGEDKVKEDEEGATGKPEEAEDAQAAGAKAEDGEDDVEEEIISAGASKAAVAPAAAAAPPPPESDAEKAQKKRDEDIARIRAKALMRRGRARSELGGWSNLEGAVEDYKKLAAMANLSPADKKIVQGQLRSLPPRAKAAQETETAEMWGKLKELGNGILKPFGLSTENFQMVKDEKTGGYSMNFQNGGK